MIDFLQSLTALEVFGWLSTAFLGTMTFSLWQIRRHLKALHWYAAKEWDALNELGQAQGQESIARQSVPEHDRQEATSYQ